MNAPVTIHCEGDRRRAERYISELERQVEDLKYERDHWKREACQLADHDCASALRQLFGELTEAESVICAALYGRRGKTLPLTSLEGLLDEERGHSVESNVVSVMVSRIRAKLGSEAVENVRGNGYRLSEAMIARLDESIE